MTASARPKYPHKDEVARRISASLPSKVQVMPGKSSPQLRKRFASHRFDDLGNGSLGFNVHRKR